MSKKSTKSERDIEILKNGAICMYHKSSILNADYDWFSSHNFEIIDMNVRNWTAKNIHQKLKEHLNFPDYYGENLNAFDDRLDDMYNKKYRGLILIFRHFDNLVEEDKRFCEGMLDTIERTSRIWFISGQKLISLIQSDDPNLYFDKLGGNRPTWNAQEWLSEGRRK